MAVVSVPSNVLVNPEKTNVYVLGCCVFYSAEFEITVNLLIQVDKLVQLIESPVFTCKLILIHRMIFHSMLMGTL